MAQHGQVLRLRTRRGDGKARWAYCYRVNGSGSKRPQVGGFATRRPVIAALAGHLGAAPGGSDRLRTPPPAPDMARGADLDIVRYWAAGDDGLALPATGLRVVGQLDLGRPCGAAARSAFTKMDSGTGFMTDLRQASAARSAYRASVLRSIQCATLVTASRHDRGVAFTHAEDFLRTIPDARLVDTGAHSHLFWLGASRQTVSNAIRDFMTE